MCALAYRPEQRGIDEILRAVWFRVTGGGSEGGGGKEDQVISEISVEDRDARAHTPSVPTSIQS